MSKSQYKLRRAEAFFELVYPVFSEHFDGGYRIVEFCAGNGNAGRLFATQSDVQAVTFVDIKKVRDLEATLRDVGDKGNFFLEGIDHYNIPANSGVIAIHACGPLTDKILKKTALAGVPVAVMTCCHRGESEMYNLQNPPNPRLLNYVKREDYLDTVRKQFLVEQRYDATIAKIDSKITPFNNVIIGVPRVSVEDTGQINVEVMKMRESASPRIK